MYIPKSVYEDKNCNYYRIISESDEIFLSKVVNDMIREGWTPKGGPFVKENYFFQAMVKMDYEDIDERIRIIK